MTNTQAGAQKSISVLFVCMGNICRSPTAEAIFRAQVEQAGLSEQIEIASAGTHGYHIGHPPDTRAQAAGARRRYDLSCLRARQVTAAHLDRYDYVLAMDSENLRHLRQMSPPEHRGKIDLFLRYGSSGATDVPDPYYGEADGFELVLDLVEEASRGLLEHLRQQLARSGDSATSATGEAVGRH